MPRSRHPKPDIEAALRHAEAHGWRIEQGGSHAWGKMLCPYDSRDCRCGVYCITSIWSTPANPGNFAKRLRRAVDGCASYRTLGPNEEVIE
ncbi:hypothetical protein L2Y96_10910 [Luteibacter aegosomaticola]|uniref:hypothetical protein n=1 Tax=Luteibacter aegosomaticola TaxID=2911538 RepID=UPI001FFAAAC0|nr:hypothetical protein [Luteibacter aegosomaticola]UPG92244.1 hypothetical protein L2Y96_10910 [Luteibacter aegosomaticola]